MESFKIITIIVSVLLINAVRGQNGQVNTPCTSSMISTFTPCLNYITGSTSNGGTSPSSDCCNALKSVMNSNMDCACLLVTASVPLPLSFMNRTLALALPRFCKYEGVPIQCKAAGVPLPAPGPLKFAPPPPASAMSPKGPSQFATPPASAFSPQASKATAATPASEPTSAAEQPPVASPPVEVEMVAPTKTSRIRPVMTRSASSGSLNFPSCIWLVVMGFILLIS